MDIYIVPFRRYFILFTYFMEIKIWECWVCVVVLSLTESSVPVFQAMLTICLIPLQVETFCELYLWFSLSKCKLNKNKKSSSMLYAVSSHLVHCVTDDSKHHKFFPQWS